MSFVRSSEGPIIPFQGSDKEPLALIGTGPMCQDLREITPIVPRSRRSLSRVSAFSSYMAPIPRSFEHVISESGARRAYKTHSSLRTVQ